MNQRQRITITYMVGHGVVLGILTMCFVNGTLSESAFSRAVIASCFIGFVILWIAFTRARRDGVASDEQVGTKVLRSRIRCLKIGVGILLLGLISALTKAGEAPILSIVIGIAINQALVWSAVRAIRRLQAQLALQAGMPDGRDLSG